MRYSFVIVSALALSATLGQTRPPASATEAMYQQATESAQRKLDHIAANAKINPPDQTPTTMTEREINTYLNSGRVRLPKGVSHLVLKGTPGMIDGAAQVDFDAITAGKRNSNPLLMLFSGVHEVAATAHANGSGHTGHVHIDSGAIDGVSVPRPALEFFLSRYLSPKYPGIGLDSTFQLPERIDIAQVGEHSLTVTQKATDH